ncbi:MAG: hypothetical protein OES14_07455, partial [Nitrosopumilus sp.]|nr:hypothetical protein [Nitrosopumilus sp.]
GKILQLSKGTLDILKNAKDNAKFRVMLISDMILTDEDGFGKILANYRKISIPKLRKLLKKDIITDSNLIAGILKSADKINYDSDIRLKVGTKITLD